MEDNFKELEVLWEPVKGIVGDVEVWARRYTVDLAKAKASSGPVAEVDHQVENSKEAR